MKTYQNSDQSLLTLLRVLEVSIAYLGGCQKPGKAANQHISKLGHYCGKKMRSMIADYCREPRLTSL